MDTILKKEGSTVWITGLSGSGKTTLGLALKTYLTSRGVPCYVLDGDQLRGSLSQDLGYSSMESEENARRAGEVALMFAKTGFLAICCLISPSKRARNAIRARHAHLRLAFHEIHLKCSLSICRARDPKGWYSKYEVARLAHQQIRVGSVNLKYEDIGSFLEENSYDIPDEPDLSLDTETQGVSECLNTLVNYLKLS
ncbi:hypothetical protein TCAL_06506 [Tigriopus californicus]|uniref:Adenylyl-sulfate kinase n=1 Tax=Tigriopus californicus TaxID=6832 RepID=A0A553PSJ4_TIGCA|nr:uncharacterized protein LOC131891688 [Tigriopus californicus]TRY80652.1 hypothetical protein TCAL_06506 [Tigriopus californicus]|eukprot:TCALIF_06506-PA protein Name:"Similar to met14 Adenylyl-sulfate kinase (Schizosaccharomyces pombe (strain 972 / ATCC 24843))" AED:0.01 eAED:0.01 QI:10/1/1/1/1/1/2/557/196